MVPGVGFSRVSQHQPRAVVPRSARPGYSRFRASPSTVRATHKFIRREKLSSLKQARIDLYGPKQSR